MSATANLIEWLTRPRSNVRIISDALALQVARGRPNAPAMPRIPLMERRLVVPPKDPIRLEEAGLAALSAYDEEMLEIPEFLRSMPHGDEQWPR